MVSEHFAPRGKQRDGLEPTTAKHMREFVLARVALVGRKGLTDTGNEDGLCEIKTPFGKAWAVLDGVTAVHTRRRYGPKDMTAGQLGREGLQETLNFLLANPEPEVTRLHLPGLLFDAWQGSKRSAGLPDEERVGAVGCVLRSLPDGSYELLRLGDAVWGYALADGTWVDSLGGGVAWVSSDAQERALAIRQAMVPHGLRPDSYAAVLRGNAKRLAEFATIGADALQRRKLAQRQTIDDQWLDSAEGVARLWHPPVQLPPDTVKVVLATDGWLRVPRSVPDGERWLMELRKNDPLTIGDNATAKGFVDPKTGRLLPGCDDRAMLVLERQLA